MANDQPLDEFWDSVPPGGGRLNLPNASPNGSCPAPAWFDLSIGPTDYDVRQLGLTLPSVQRTMPPASLVLTLFIGPNGQRPASGSVPVAPNKLGAWGCGLVNTTIAGWDFVY
jgi:hypothetical protein